jgi:hypothetical protein
MVAANFLYYRLGRPLLPINFRCTPGLPDLYSYTSYFGLSMHIRQESGIYIANSFFVTTGDIEDF